MPFNNQSTVFGNVHLVNSGDELSRLQVAAKGFDGVSVEVLANYTDSDIEAAAKVYGRLALQLESNRQDSYQDRQRLADVWATKARTAQEEGGSVVVVEITADPETVLSHVVEDFYARYRNERLTASTSGTSFN